MTAEPAPIDTPYGPIHIRIREDLPDHVVALMAAPPAPGTAPGHPDWMPPERRVAAVVDGR